MGTVTKSIGTTGRDFSTITAWVASIPANLVTDGNIYQGLCYNDTEFTEKVTISGHTTDATHYIELTTGPGQSFQDNASVRSNALIYNQSNGVGNRYTSTGPAFTISDSYTRFSKFQVKTTNAYSMTVSANSAATTNVIYKDLICDTAGTSSGGSTVGLLDIGSFAGAGGYMANVILYSRAGGANGIKVSGTTQAIGCGAIQASGVSTTRTGFVSQYGSNKLQSCVCFGFAVAADAVAWDGTNSKNNGTNLSTGFPGSANQYSITYSATSPFTQAGTTGTDLRTATGTTLTANGFRDATNAPNDISGTARTSTPTIGHWELASAPATPTGFYGQYPDFIQTRVQVVPY